MLKISIDRREYYDCQEASTPTKVIHMRPLSHTQLSGPLQIQPHWTLSICREYYDCQEASTPSKVIHMRPLSHTQLSGPLQIQLHWTLSLWQIRTVTVLVAVVVRIKVRDAVRSGPIQVTRHEWPTLTHVTPIRRSRALIFLPIILAHILLGKHTNGES